MSSRNSIIKSKLLSLYKKGITENEAYKAIAKTHSSYGVTLTTVNKWFELFKSRVSNSDDKQEVSRKNRLTEESLVNLVKDNPKFNMKELSRLANVSQITISRKLKQINDNSDITNYSKKSRQKFTYEYIIDLVNNNPDLNTVELSRIAGTSASTIYRRIKQINSDGERVKYVKKAPELNKNIPGQTSPKLKDENLISLINNNPELSLEKLATLTGYSRQAISRRIKQINKYGERVNYQSKSGKKFTDEFLVNLVNENPDFNQEELAILADVRRDAISKRLEEINITGKSVNYVSKNHIPKVTDEFLINLISQNPDLNIQELAELAGTSPKTISNRIKAINSEGEKIKYIKKSNNKSK
jgi:DeoR/GlpR family transcriptional regulator of sugar metabolism